MRSAAPGPPHVVEYALGDDERLTAAARLAFADGVAVLPVGVGSREARIGPLTEPGRVGCAHCARQRMHAAAALAVPAPEGTAWEPDLEDILARDPSSFLDHVLVVGPDGEAAHRVVPLARCEVCGGAAALVEAPAAGDPLAGWVGPVTGVIPGLSVDDGADGLVVVTAEPPHVVEADGTLRQLPVGWGKGLTPIDAVTSAVGEAIERYSASLPDESRIVWARPDELDGERLDPRDLPLYSEEQYARPGFPFARFDPEVAHPWVRGWWLGTEREVWVPAVPAFLSLTIDPGQLFCQGTSNGLASSTSLEDAALRATMELVERDALLTAWLTGTPAQRLRIDTLEPSLAAVQEGVEALGGAVELSTLPTAAAGTVVLCLARGDGDRWPGVTIGLGADLDPSQALRKAILELGQTGPYLRRLLRTGAVEVPTGPEFVAAMLDHAAFYFPPERAAAFDFLRSGGETSLPEATASLDEAGLRVAIVDVTAPDVALGPFRVARALSPDLQPLTYGYGLDRVATARVRALGLSAAQPPVHPVW